MFTQSKLRLPRPVRSCGVALPIVFLAGCIHQGTTDTEMTFRYEYWVPLLTFVGGVAAVPLGWAARRRAARFGWALVVIGLIAALGVAPSLLGDQFVVANDHFQAQSGFWGMSSVTKVKYDDMQSLRIMSETSTGRRGRKKTEYYFVCQMKSGGPIKIAMNNKIAEAAVIPILTQMAAHKIPISDEVGDHEG